MVDFMDQIYIKFFKDNRHILSDEVQDMIKQKYGDSTDTRKVLDSIPKTLDIPQSYSSNYWYQIINNYLNIENNVYTERELQKKKDYFVESECIRITFLHCLLNGDFSRIDPEHLMYNRSMSVDDIKKKASLMYFTGNNIFIDDIEYLKRMRLYKQLKETLKYDDLYILKFIAEYYINVLDVLFEVSEKFTRSKNNNFSDINLGVMGYFSNRLSISRNFKNLTPENIQDLSRYKYENILFRGQIKPYSKDSNKIKIPSFTSTSRLYQEAEYFGNNIYLFQLREGQHFLPMINSYHKNEKEILLNKNLLLKVKQESKYTDDNIERYIYLLEVENDNTSVSSGGRGRGLTRKKNIKISSKLKSSSKTRKKKYAGIKPIEKEPIRKKEPIEKLLINKIEKAIESSIEKINSKNKTEEGKTTISKYGEIIDKFNEEEEKMTKITEQDIINIEKIDYYIMTSCILNSIDVDSIHDKENSQFKDAIIFTKNYIALKLFNC